MSEERSRPTAVRELYELSDEDLVLKTETPSRMILPMVRLAVIDAAADPKRKKSLLQVFREAFDRRMISKERKGRLELLAAVQAVIAGEDEDIAEL